MKKKFIGFVFTSSLAIAAISFFGLSQDANAASSFNSAPRTWCGDINDDRCCVVWGWHCEQPVIIIGGGGNDQ